MLCHCLERGVKGSGAVAKMRHTAAVAAAATIAIAGMADVAAAAVECTAVTADVIEAG